MTKKLYNNRQQKIPQNKKRRAKLSTNVFLATVAVHYDPTKPTISNQEAVAPPCASPSPALSSFPSPSGTVAAPSPAPLVLGASLSAELRSPEAVGFAMAEAEALTTFPPVAGAGEAPTAGGTPVHSGKYWFSTTESQYK